jgi:antitoxin (DNA-binding transcriptional repressor) of toxin-antitoxin stability system
MDDTPISVTLASRKFADFINLVRYHGATFLLEKNGVPVARIVPVQTGSGSDINQLSAAFGQSNETPLSHTESGQLTVQAQCEVTEPTHNQESANLLKRPRLNW